MKSFTAWMRAQCKVDKRMSKKTWKKNFKHTHTHSCLLATRKICRSIEREIYWPFPRGINAAEPVTDGRPVPKLGLLPHSLSLWDVKFVRLRSRSCVHESDWKLFSSSFGSFNHFLLELELLLYFVFVQYCSFDVWKFQVNDYILGSLYRKILTHQFD